MLLAVSCVAQRTPFPVPKLAAPTVIALLFEDKTPPVATLKDEALGVITL